MENSVDQNQTFSQDQPAWVVAFVVVIQNRKYNPLIWRDMFYVGCGDVEIEERSSK